MWSVIEVQGARVTFNEETFLSLSWEGEGETFLQNLHKCSLLRSLSSHLLNHTSGESHFSSCVWLHWLSLGLCSHIILLFLVTTIIFIYCKYLFNDNFVNSEMASIMCILFLIAVSLDWSQIQSVFTESMHTYECIFHIFPIFHSFQT